jgi:hypothetical protein
MRLHEVLEQVHVGGSFYRKSNPAILYERIGTLIERDGLGWARLEGNNWGYEWIIIPEQRIEEDIRATDWTLQKSDAKESACSSKKPRLRPLYTEKTRRAWTFYDQVEPPRQS